MQESLTLHDVTETRHCAVPVTWCERGELMANSHNPLELRPLANAVLSALQIAANSVLLRCSSFKHVSQCRNLCNSFHHLPDVLPSFLTDVIC